jgi:hypothetical protein
MLKVPPARLDDAAAHHAASEVPVEHHVAHIAVRPSVDPPATARRPRPGVYLPGAVTRQPTAAIQPCTACDARPAGQRFRPGEAGLGTQGFVRLHSPPGSGRISMIVSTRRPCGNRRALA